MQSLKTLFILVSLYSSHCLAFADHETQVQSAYSGVLQSELESQGSQRYLGASLSLDGRKGLVEISLQPIMPRCPEGRACAQVMPMPVSYVVEEAQSKIDSCHIIRTVASFDQRPVDGIFLKVTILNNTNNTCPTFAPLPALEMIVETAYVSRLEGKTIETLDSFTSESFEILD